MPGEYTILRHKGIVYLIKKELPSGKEPFGVYTYDLENPVRVGTWTNESGLVYSSSKILEALKTSKNSTELQEKCKCE